MVTNDFDGMANSTDKKSQFGIQQSAKLALITSPNGAVHAPVLVFKLKGGEHMTEGSGILKWKIPKLGGLCGGGARVVRDAAVWQAGGCSPRAFIATH